MSRERDLTKKAMIQIAKNLGLTCCELFNMDTFSEDMTFQFRDRYNYVVGTVTVNIYDMSHFYTGPNLCDGIYNRLTRAIGKGQLNEHNIR